MVDRELSRKKRLSENSSLKLKIEKINDSKEHSFQNISELVMLIISKAVRRVLLPSKRIMPLSYFWWTMALFFSIVFLVYFGISDGILVIVMYFAVALLIALGYEAVCFVGNYVHKLNIFKLDQPILSNVKPAIKKYEEELQFAISNEKKHLEELYQSLENEQNELTSMYLKQVEQLKNVVNVVPFIDMKEFNQKQATLQNMIQDSQKEVEQILLQLKKLDQDEKHLMVEISERKAHISRQGRSLISARRSVQTTGIFSAVWMSGQGNSQGLSV